jgi:hypothetical protein
MFCFVLPLLVNDPLDSVSLFPLTSFHVEKFGVFVTMLQPISSRALLPPHFFSI